MKIVKLLLISSLFLVGTVKAACHCRIQLDGKDVYDPGKTIPIDGSKNDYYCVQECKRLYLDAAVESTKSKINVESQCKAKAASNQGLLGKNFNLDLNAWGRTGTGGSVTDKYASLNCLVKKELKCPDGHWPEKHQELNNFNQFCVKGAEAASLQSLVQSSKDTNAFVSAFNAQGYFVWDRTLFQKTTIKAQVVESVQANWQ